MSESMTGDAGTKEVTLEERLREAMSDGGPDGVTSLISSLPEEKRLDAYAFAQRTFGPRGDAAVSLDDYTIVARAGIAEAERLTAAASSPERAASLKDAGNVMSFNLLADLAECWPDDTLEREQRHFEEGLRAAVDCIRWREELGKPNGRKAMGWWGKGMHLLSLGRSAEAVDAFRVTCELVYDGSELKASADGSFDQLLYLGYLGLGRIATGDSSGEHDLASARSAFETQIADESKREDAQFGLDQLGVVERKIRAR